ncbi:MAG: TraR/DksA C4-type zinc finger protein [Anaerolineae bacterium]|jgi:RNA polymerase-binding protein DksA|nr:TraR/DksA C4-type zinc finger protein [Anaerolineae bacterium]
MDRTQAFRERLERDLQETQARIAQLRERLEAKGDYGPGRGDPAIFQWELNLAMLQQAEEQARQVREALARLEAGTYGICQKCGQPIDEERLELLPLTTYCIRCAQSTRSGRG